MVGAEDFEPAALMAGLEAEMQEAGPCGPLPSVLPVAAIETLPALFQVREISDQHAEDIARALRDGAEVPPLLVLRVGHRAIVIDGHHRLEAHRLAGRVEAVPVVGFEGELKEAVLAACAANSVTKLPMTAAERQDAAWRYVCMGVATKPDIAKATGSSTSTVATMRRVKAALGPSAFDIARWGQAVREARGALYELSDDEREEQLDAAARRRADALARTFSSKLYGNLDITARAFKIHFGRRLPALVAELQGHLGESGEDY